MSSRNFRERLLLTTRGKILGHLRSGPSTVNKLAAATGLTDNAVRAHLVSLERDGLITPTGTQPGVRRPHVSYGLTGEAEQFFPKAYGVLLSHFFNTVAGRLTEDELDDTLREVGRAIASPHTPDLASKTRRERILSALKILGQIGGAAVLVQEGESQVIQGSNCPLAALTEQHPHACIIAEALLSDIIGVPVTERCSHEAGPKCCFVVSEDV